MAEDTSNRYVGPGTVRDRLIDAQKRRGDLSFMQKVTLYQVEWAASDQRMGYKASPEVFDSLYERFIGMEKLEKNPEVAAKLAEILPLSSDDIRAILATRRVSMSGDEIEQVLEAIAQEIGVE